MLRFQTAATIIVACILGYVFSASEPVPQAIAQPSFSLDEPLLKLDIESLETSVNSLPTLEQIDSTVRKALREEKIQCDCKCEPTLAKSADESDPLIRVVMHRWPDKPCEPCERWIRLEQPKFEAAGIAVSVLKDLSENYSAPQFTEHFRDGTSKLVVGYLKYEPPAPKADPLASVHAPSDLEKRIKQLEFANALRAVSSPASASVRSSASDGGSSGSVSYSTRSWENAASYPLASSSGGSQGSAVSYSYPVQSGYVSQVQSSYSYPVQTYSYPVRTYRQPLRTSVRSTPLRSNCQVVNGRVICN